MHTSVAPVSRSCFGRLVMWCLALRDAHSRDQEMGIVYDHRRPAERFTRNCRRGLLDRPPTNNNRMEQPTLLYARGPYVELLA